MCAPGWHVCLDANDVTRASVTGCGGATRPNDPLLLFLTRQSSTGCGVCATGTQTDASCNSATCKAGCLQTEYVSNDVFGCGNYGSMPSGACNPLNRFSGNMCGSIGSQGWSCNLPGPADDSGYCETFTIVHSNPSTGGVLCCRNGSSSDSDKDGVLDEDDNCIAIPNPEQTDTDGDGYGDACDESTPVNQPPTANAGGPYTTPEGSEAFLDGSASTDPDGDALTFNWDLDNDGSYDDATGPTASFFGIDGPSTHTVGLEVCDGKGACDSSTTTVQVVNVAPVADAGADQTVYRNAPMSLTGTWSDPAGAEDNAYAWSWDLNGDGVADASGFALWGTPITQSTSFAVAGTYTLTFRVTDKDGASHSDTVTLTVLNHPPTANAGGPYTTPEGSAATLDGSASTDPEGDALTFAWDLDNDGSYDDATGPTASFFGVDGPSTHTVGLKVCDGGGACASSTTTVQVVNVAPVADAGADQTVYRNAPVSLTGTWSDPAGAADNAYAWSWDLNGDGVADASGLSAWGTPITQSTSFAVAGTYTLTFRVTDKDGASHSDTVTLTVLNRPPDCSKAAPSISLLWPPNHQMVAVSVQHVMDGDGDPLNLTITSIRQDEPVNDIADGNTAVDGAGVGTGTAMVRAERSGSPRNPGNGRVYHIGFTATDGHGGTCSGVVQVGVPHDQGGQKWPVDDGPLYNSLQP
jgi:hypothetical protein